MSLCQWNLMLYFTQVIPGNKVELSLIFFSIRASLEFTNVFHIQTFVHIKANFLVCAYIDNRKKHLETYINVNAIKNGHGVWFSSFRLHILGLQ